MDTYSLEIVTPIKILSKENVNYIRCPGIDGSFGIMKKHRQGVIALDVGEIKIDANGKTDWYATSGGFVEIGQDKIELLLESVEKSNEIDVKRATEALERAKDRKKNPTESIDDFRLEAALTRAINRLRVSRKSI